MTDHHADRWENAERALRRARLRLLLRKNPEVAQAISEKWKEEPDE